MTQWEQAQQAQEEQLDWLHQIHEEMQKQTAILTDVRRHSGLIYALAIIWIILTVLGLVFYLFQTAG